MAEALDRLKANGGIVMVNFYPAYVVEQTRQWNIARAGLFGTLAITLALFLFSRLEGVSRGVLAAIPDLEASLGGATFTVVFDQAPFVEQSIEALAQEGLLGLIFAVVVILIVVGYGIYKNGLKFFKIFVPTGVPMYILPLVMFIEILSFFLRPVSHSVRLFANMLAGHITLKVFAGFVTSLSALGALGIGGAILPLLMTVALTGLEFLVAFLQAYVFAVLTCMYLNDAVHPGGH